MTSRVCGSLNLISSKIILSAIVAWIALASLAVASQLSVARADEISIKTSYLEDAGNQKTISDVEADATIPFEGFLSRGYSNSTYWIRIDIANAPANEPLVLTVSPYYLDDIALFDPTTGLESGVAGITHAPSEEVRAFLPHTFLLSHRTGSQAYWLRVRSRSSIIMSLNITPLGAAYIAEEKRNFLSAIYIGCLLMFALMGIALAWRSNDPAVRIFPIYEIGAAIFALNLFGYFGLWLRPVLQPEGIARIHQVATVAAALTAGIFHTMFLRGLGATKPWLALAIALILVNFSEFGMIAADFVQMALQTNAALCLIYSTLFLAMALSLPDRRTTAGFPKAIVVSYYAISFILIGLMALQLQGVRSPIDNVFFGNILYGFLTGVLMLGMLAWRTLRIREQEHETRQGLALAVDGASLGIWRFHPHERVVSLSNRFATHFGLPAETRAVSYDRILSIIHADDRDAVDAALNKSIVERSDFIVEHRVVWPDGSEHWIYGHGRPAFSEDGALKQLDGITIDTTDRKLNEMKYIESLGTINAAFASMSEGIVIGDTKGNLLSGNEAAVSFLRIKSFDEIPKTYSEFIDSMEIFTLDGERLTADTYPFALALKGRKATYELKMCRKDTRDTWYGLIGSSPIYGKNNEIVGAVVTGLDITERIERQNLLEEEVKQRTHELALANQALIEISRHDALTGIYNRMACDERMKAEFQRMKRTNDCYSILMIDIDLFKQVNDSCGHAIGDEVLKFVADTLSRNLREYDFLARWGGEEFLVLLPVTDFEQACVVAEKLRFAVEAETHPIAGTVTISVGVAIASPHDLDGELAVMRADDALYEAKEGGRNRVVSKPTQRDTHPTNPA